MNRRKIRKVLDCASPLSLWIAGTFQSARGLAHSKTLRAQFRFLVTVPDGRSQNSFPVSGYNLTSGFFQMGTTRFISSINHWQEANASPR